MKKSKSIIFDYVLESLALAFLFMCFFIVVFSYSKLPSSINLNYHFSGSPDKVGHKINLFFLPGMAVVLNLLIASIQKNPQQIFGKFLNSDSKKSDHAVRWSLRFLIIVKFLINFSAFVILYQTIYNPIGEENKLSKIFFPVILCILLLPLVFLIYRFAIELRKLVK